jgi:hypothetical protein
VQIETWPVTEIEGPLYNVRDVVQPPGAVMGYGPYADVLTGRRELPQLPPSAAPPPDDVQEGAPVVAPAAPPYAGASRLLRWSTQIVLSSGYDQRHPLSSKVEVTLRLRELAAELGISPRGVAHIAALCGHRRVPCVCVPQACCATRRTHAGCAALVALGVCSQATPQRALCLCCCRRYNAPTDTLRLVSQRYYTREDNRRDCLRIINGARGSP